MGTVNITECKSFRMIDKSGTFTGCPYLSEDRDYGCKCSAIDTTSHNPKSSVGVYDVFFTSNNFPGCPFGIDYSDNKINRKSVSTLSYEAKGIKGRIRPVVETLNSNFGWNIVVDVEKKETIKNIMIMIHKKHKDLSNADLKFISDLFKVSH